LSCDPKLAQATGMRRVLLGLLVLGWAACADEPVPRRSERALDKAALFGDPGLVPTREGEQARREAARAGEIRAAVELLSGVDAARVDVESGGDDTRVLVVVRLDDAQAQQEVIEASHRIIDTVLGSEGVHTVVEVSTPPPDATPEPTPRTVWPFALAVLGLGFSLGVTFDRARRLLRRRTRRRSTRG
jgi:hypothetical protein